MAGPLRRLRGRVVAFFAIVAVVCLVAFVVSFGAAFAHGKSGGQGHRDVSSAVSVASRHQTSHHPRKSHGSDDEGSGDQGSGDEDDNQGDREGPPTTGSVSTPAPAVSSPAAEIAPGSLAFAPSSEAGPAAGAVPETPHESSAPAEQPAPTGSVEGIGVSPLPVIGPPPPPVPQIGFARPIVAGEASASTSIALEVAFVVGACIVTGLVGSRLLVRRR